MEHYSIRGKSFDWFKNTSESTSQNKRYDIKQIFTKFWKMTRYNIRTIVDVFCIDLNDT